MFYTYHRRIQNPFKHLRCNFLQKQLTAKNRQLCKKLHLRCLAGFCMRPCIPLVKHDFQEVALSIFPTHYNLLTYNNIQRFAHHSFLLYNTEQHLTTSGGLRNNLLWRSMLFPTMHRLEQQQENTNIFLSALISNVNMLSN